MRETGKAAEMKKKMSEAENGRHVESRERLAFAMLPGERWRAKKREMELQSRERLAKLLKRR